MKENISNTWKVKPIGNTPRPGSLTTKDDVSTFIQPEIGPDDTLEGVIRRYVLYHSSLFDPNNYITY